MWELPTSTVKDWACVCRDRGRPVSPVHCPKSCCFHLEDTKPGTSVDMPKFCVCETDALGRAVVGLSYA